MSGQLPDETVQEGPGEALILMVGSSMTGALLYYIFNDSVTHYLTLWLTRQHMLFLTFMTPAICVLTAFLLTLSGAVLRGEL